MGGRFSSENEQAWEPVYGAQPGPSNGRNRGERNSTREPSGQRAFPDHNVLDQRFVRASSVIEGLNIPNSTGLRLYYSPSPNDGNEQPGTSSRRTRYAVSQSLPPYIIRSMFMQDSCCPICKKLIPADDVEVHTVMCLTKPRITYNEETLMISSENECAICLDSMLEGDAVARLPCLCIYHKTCIDEWFERSQTCPEHPPD